MRKRDRSDICTFTEHVVFGEGEGEWPSSGATLQTKANGLLHCNETWL